MQQSDAHFRVFDLSRRVQSLPKTTFEKFEEGHIAYPYPLQRHAWFAVLFWNKDAISSPFLWFLKLPLDEQGLLIQSARDHYLSIVLDALGNQMMSATYSEEQEKRLQQNPYHFTPQQNKLAALNSQIRMTLHQAPSDYFQPVSDYIASADNKDNWQELGFQGLSDLVVRATDDDITKALANSIDWLPTDVFAPICAAMEHSKPTVAIAESLTRRLKKAIVNSDILDALSCIRGLSNSSATGLKNEAIDVYLHSDIVDVDGLQLIAARAWESLEDNGRMLIYMEKLAVIDATEPDSVFVPIMHDLLYMPTTKISALACLRSPERSIELMQAIGLLFGQLRNE